MSMKKYSGNRYAEFIGPALLLGFIVLLLFSNAISWDILLLVILPITVYLYGYCYYMFNSFSLGDEVFHIHKRYALIGRNIFIAKTDIEEITVRNYAGMQRHPIIEVRLKDGKRRRYHSFFMSSEVAFQLYKGLERGKYKAEYDSNVD